MSNIVQFRDPTLVTDGSVVGFYEREFYMFSNFSSFQVEWNGYLWPTSEHAYQAARFMGVQEDLVASIKDCRSAHDAYKIAKSNITTQRVSWDNEKIDVMYQICRAKLIQHAYIQSHLLSTNEEKLVEDSPKDNFWGWGVERTGRNELGKIWMRLREELRHGQLQT